MTITRYSHRAETENRNSAAERTVSVLVEREYGELVLWASVAHLFQPGSIQLLWNEVGPSSTWPAEVWLIGWCRDRQPVEGRPAGFWTPIYWQAGQWLTTFQYTPIPDDLEVFAWAEVPPPEGWAR